MITEATKPQPRRHREVLRHVGRRARLVTGLAAVLLGVGAYPGPAAAVPATTYYGTFDIPAGEGCTFPVSYDVYTADHTGAPDVAGRTGFFLTAGLGSTLVFHNAMTGTSVTFPVNGAVSQTYGPQARPTRIVDMGHNVVDLFSTDTGGPSLTLYVGRVVIDIGENGTWTVRRAAADATDVCALLAA